jgi:hypothetical protein
VWRITLLIGQVKFCCRPLISRHECRVVVVDGDGSQIMADESGRELRDEWRNASTREASLREYMDITTQMNAESIAMRRVRSHPQDLHLAGVVNAMERNKGIQGGQHYLFELSADLGTTIDVLQENERLGNVMDRIV